MLKNLNSIKSWHHLSSSIWYVKKIWAFVSFLRNLSIRKSNQNMLHYFIRVCSFCYLNENAKNELVSLTSSFRAKKNLCLWIKTNLNLVKETKRSLCKIKIYHSYIAATWHTFKIELFILSPKQSNQFLFLVW